MVSNAARHLPGSWNGSFQRWASGRVPIADGSCGAPRMRSETRGVQRSAYGRPSDAQCVYLQSPRCVQTVRAYRMGGEWRLCATVKSPTGCRSSASCCAGAVRRSVYHRCAQRDIARRGQPPAWSGANPRMPVAGCQPASAPGVNGEAALHATQLSMTNCPCSEGAARAGERRVRLPREVA